MERQSEIFGRGFELVDDDSFVALVRGSLIELA